MMTQCALLLSPTDVYTCAMMLEAALAVATVAMSRNILSLLPYQAMLTYACLRFWFCARDFEILNRGYSAYMYSTGNGVKHSFSVHHIALQGRDDIIHVHVAQYVR